MTLIHTRGMALGAFALAAAGLAGQAHAGSFYLADQSTVATGRAYSGETASQGAQQMGYNPAAIGGITGIQQYIGFTALLPKADAVNRGTTYTKPALFGGATVPVTGASAKDPINNGYLPNGGIAVAVTSKIAVGFTMTSPYSFTTNYDGDFFGRYSADKSRLRTFDFQPTIAWAPSPHLSFGAAPNIEYVRATLSNKLPDPLSASYGVPASPFPDGEQLLKGTAVDVGYTFGFQFHNDKIDLGASYKSAIKHHFSGHLTLDGITDPLLAGLVNQRIGGAKASFTTPWIVSVGLRYHLTPKFTINTQVSRFGWDKFYAIDIYNIATNDTGAASNIPNQQVVENYHNSWTYSVGFDYDIARKLTLRGGVTRDESPITDGYRDPRVPDGNRVAYAGGATYKLNQFIGLDFAAEYAHIASNPLNSAPFLYDGTPLQSQTQNDGVLKNAHALLFSVGAHLAL